MKAGKETELYNQGYMDGFDDAQRAHIEPIKPKIKDVKEKSFPKTRLEHQYAGMAMQGMLSGWWSESIAKIAKSDGAHFDIIVHKANELAHALVQKLKEKEERK